MTLESSNIAVLFDTNSYRQLTLNKSKNEIKILLKKIRKLESKKDIQAYCIFIVALELLANLAEGKNGINFTNCVQSLIFLSNHCFNPKAKTINLIPPPYIHVTNNVFGALPIDYDSSTKENSDFINNFRIYNGLLLTRLYNEKIFENLKNSVQVDEQNFSHYIIRLINSARTIVKNKNPKISDKHLKDKLLEYLKSQEFEQTISMSMLKAVSDELEIEISTEELFKRATFLRNVFPFSVAFLKWIMYKIVQANIDMQSKTSVTKRWNWLWDYQVSFLITKHTLESRDILIVTSDHDIIEMNKEYGFNSKVLTLSEYMEFLKT